MKEIRLHTITYIALVILIIVSFLFAESSISSAFILIIALTAIKFFSVGFQFVEVKHSHPAWKVLIIFFIMTYTIGLAVLY